MKPGIYANISNADYHGGAGVSNSMLCVLREKSPMHLKALRDAANDNEPTPAQLTGTAFHAMVLEPEEFVKTYCLGLRMSDVPDAIDDREVLVAMVNELNTKRLPKLSTSGSKDELAWRVIESLGPFTPEEQEAIKGEKIADLKSRIAQANETRPGLLAVSTMNRHEIADLLRANGRQVTLWSDVQAEWMKNNSHRIVLTQAQWDQLHRMRDAVMAHPAARAILTGCKYVTEHSVYAIDPETDELRRCRPDLWRFDGIVGDLKTTDDASPEAFARSIAKWGYDVQHPYYVDTINEALAQQDDKSRQGVDYPDNAKAFVFIAVEKQAPHAVAVYVLDEASVAVGRAKYRGALDTYTECRGTGVWPGYGDKVQTISLPQWHMNQNAHLVGAA